MVLFYHFYSHVFTLVVLEFKQCFCYHLATTTKKEKIGPSLPNFPHDRMATPLGKFYWFSWFYLYYFSNISLTGLYFSIRNRCV